PTTDPFSMIAMALPMTILLMITEQIAKVSEKRRATREADDPVANDKVLAELNALDEQERLEREAAKPSDSSDADQDATARTS
ncbi:MAG TPA: twin-arginine translocase subunit TatC, partial [Candidatus Avipropionibacterium avicola]|nr:twin-arginine translocase subunit TatC [Candidatus Avipropionibacterium avicola]